MFRRRHILLWIVLLGMGTAAWADPTDVDRLEAYYETNEQRIKQISDRLDLGVVPDAMLESDLDTLLDYQRQIQSNARALSAMLATPTRRLKELGPPPAPGAPPESRDIAALRKRLNDEISRLAGLFKRAFMDRDEAERLIVRIRNIQGARFLSQLLARDTSPFSPTFWTDAAADVPLAIDALENHVRSWWQDQRSSGRWPADLALLAAALAGAVVILIAPRWSRWRTLEMARHANPTPSAVDKRRRVALVAMSRGMLAAAAGAVLYGAAVEVGLVGATGQVFALRIWIGFAAIVFVRNFARESYSPRDEAWRTAAIGSQAARPLYLICVAIFSLFVADRVLAAGFELAGAGPQLHLTVAAFTSVLSAVLLLLFIRIRQRPWGAAGHALAPVAAPDVKPNSTPPATAVPPKPKHPWRDLLPSAGWVLAILILVANALAYVDLAGFVFHRLALLGLFLILFHSVRVLTLWGLSALPFVAATPADTSETNQERRRLGLWLRMAVDAALLALGVPSFLLIVGYGWLDVRSWLGKLNSDMQVGAVSLSFGNFLTAVLAYLAISIGTRWVTNFVDNKVLARTHLDPGERNSIVVLVKYVGIVVALLVALAIVGVSLTKLMIVAGGLSVGIGLGLQSVVNNFVSGLILLFERPIKIGDWVKVSAGEGYVKHIGARATEILTFDRASIVVPNADLITSSVQNWFYKSRLGRVRVEVGVGYGADPEHVRSILLDCAAKSELVMAAPAPEVRWLDFGDSSLDFELRAYIGNYDNALAVASELRFAIFKALRDADIEIPFPQRDLHIRSDDTKGGITSA